MKPIGVLLVVAGWLLPLTTLAFTPSNTARLIAALAGIGIALVGIMGVLNRAHLKHAIWKAPAGGGFYQPRGERSSMHMVREETTR